MSFMFDPTTVTQEEREEALSGKSFAKDDLPAGYYKVIVDGSRTTSFQRDGNEVEALVIDLKVIEGPFESASMSEWITPNHPTEGAATASRKQLVRISQAVFGDVRSFYGEELQDKIFGISRTKTKKKTGDGEFANNLVISVDEYEKKKHLNKPVGAAPVAASKAPAKSAATKPSESDGDVPF